MAEPEVRAGLAAASARLPEALRAVVFTQMLNYFERDDPLTIEIALQFVSDWTGTRPDDRPAYRDAALVVIEAASSNAPPPVLADALKERMVGFVTSDENGVAERARFEAVEMYRSGDAVVRRAVRALRNGDGAVAKRWAWQITGDAAELVAEDTPADEDQLGEDRADNAAEPGTSTPPAASPPLVMAVHAAQPAVDETTAVVQKLLEDIETGELEVGRFERLILEQLSEDLADLSSQVKDSLDSGGLVSFAIPGKMQALGNFLLLASQINGAANLAERATELTDVAMKLLQ